MSSISFSETWIGTARLRILSEPVGSTRREGLIQRPNGGALDQLRLIGQGQLGCGFQDLSEGRGCLHTFNTMEPLISARPPRHLTLHAYRSTLLGVCGGS